MTMRLDGWCRFRRVRLALVVLASCLFAGSLGAEPVAPSMVRVVDGDTIDVRGERYRLVGFDTPETWKPRCDYERALGETAAARLTDLIDSGRVVDLIVLPGRDRYDRGLARLFIGGSDVKDVLIGEGLARAYDGGRRTGWC
ncbi:thermonuclease family protein [Jannaschia rubra]|uniref:Endonuclease YncB n=1 Tax=Jannaschia rubra TaxID=282197 RepID=A0A0M6XWY8_9RHOB|nr:thermonuclease family protein [Jannaschia rubra]CTQ34444.1 Endonuclease YncB precursor [Jannaschia rubra]